MINFIPIIGVWALIENGFLPGTEGKNRFGEDPLERSASNIEEITASEEATSEITDGEKKKPRLVQKKLLIKQVVIKKKSLLVKKQLLKKLLNLLKTN